MRIGSLTASQLDASVFNATLATQLIRGNATRRAKINPHCGLPAYNNSLAYNRQAGLGYCCMDAHATGVYRC